MNIKKTIGALMMCAISATPMMAQQTCAESYQPCTYQEMEQLTVNEQVTTVITARWRSACHRDHCDGTIPHTICAALYHKTTRGSDG